MAYNGNWTGWGNGTPSMTSSDRVHEVLAYVEAISSPLVCLVGTLLNLMAVGAFLSKPLRRISCCLYLATRSLAVFGFLISMATAWSNTFTTLIGTEGICEMTIFLSYFCPFLSVWMVVIISLENFIRIAQPSRVSSLCNPRVAQFVIATFFIIGLAVYNFPLWTSRVVGGQCRVLVQFVQIVLILNYIDTALTLLAPFALLIILVPLVALSAFHAYDRKKRLAAGRAIRPGAQEVKSTPEARVTHLLLAVSVVFLLLHTPFHAIRIKYFILTLAGAQDQITELDQILHQVFRLFYNLDSCVSCAVYLIFGDNFRRVFCNMYFSRLRNCQRRHVQAITSTTEHTAIEISNVDTTPSQRGKMNHVHRNPQNNAGHSNGAIHDRLPTSTDSASNSSSTTEDDHQAVPSSSPVSLLERKCRTSPYLATTHFLNGDYYQGSTDGDDGHKESLLQQGNDCFGRHGCGLEENDNYDDQEDDDVYAEIDEERQTKRGLLSTESVDV